ncbi:protein of unknown function [Taphrina deformans PYCC 5710]|uniref:Ribosome recycling factor domain-containing protein n=1 Tax=Taphrina deformans (strain PYCC 5710 / ATCC 11124 / CBS 356.35 / IMI 108563 / JCM 9778 / NBRC 8474) TaxID=1097556 RepID=R4XGZ8_TAPDE|nr:protein of unknown function [Taphrina deformans PYCC 5710]|eukprot:CCG83788.1 protein of unknown function [Taphrina deformans PYCC 5710]
MLKSTFRSASVLLVKPARITRCARVYQHIKREHQRHAFSTTIAPQAKNKNKGKSESASSSTSPSGDSSSLGALLNSTIVDAEAATQAAVHKLNEQVKQLRAGRQDPGKLKNLLIPGEDTTLGSLAAVTQKNPKTFLVTVYDPAHVKQISSAIASSGQNFNPQPVPNNPMQLTINIPSESAIALGQKVKLLNELGVKAKDAVRHARGNAIRAIRASGGSIDQMTPIEKKVHALVTKHNTGIDKVVEDNRKAIGS